MKTAAPFKTILMSGVAVLAFQMTGLPSEAVAAEARLGIGANVAGVNAGVGADAEADIEKRENAEKSEATAPITPNHSHHPKRVSPKDVSVKGEGHVDGAVDNEEQGMRVQTGVGASVEEDPAPAGADGAPSAESGITTNGSLNGDLNNR